MTEITGGLAGQMLRVDLTHGRVQAIATPRDLFSRFLGARGVGAYMLYHELPPHTDPLGPDNKLIFLTGPLEGTLAPGANKNHRYVSLSPVEHLLFFPVRRPSGPRVEVCGV